MFSQVKAFDSISNWFATTFGNSSAAVNYNNSNSNSVRSNNPNANLSSASSTVPSAVTFTGASNNNNDYSSNSSSPTKPKSATTAISSGGALQAVENLSSVSGNSTRSVTAPVVINHAQSKDYIPKKDFFDNHHDENIQFGKNAHNRILLENHHDIGSNTSSNVDLDFELSTETELDNGEALFSSSLPPPPNTLDNVNKYSIEDVIGVGGTCLVRRATCKFTNSQVAVKVFDKTNMPEESLNQLAREIQVWNASTHPNIVRLFTWHETKTGVYLFCQLAPKGNLLNFITNSHPAGRLTEEEAKGFFLQLIDALHYCHTVLGVVHGDVKLDNILLDENASLKLCDFGLSRSIETPPSQQFSPSPVPNEGHGGTLLYLAPEQLVEQCEANPASDVWSAGVTLYAMLEGRFPFDEDFEPRLYNKIIKGEYPPPQSCSAECRDLIEKMLQVKVEDRITIAEIKKHPWLQIVTVKSESETEK